MRRRALLSALALPPALLRARPARAASASDRYFQTSDGVRLHYTDQGRPSGPMLLFVPGWTMPGWIFGPQVTAFSGGFRVVTFDPRGQGFSDVPAGGYDAERRGADLAELIQHLGTRPVVIGWSLGVLDTLAMVAARGDSEIEALVLVDNSIGEEPAPIPRPPRPRAPPAPQDVRMRRFVASMFRSNPSPSYLEALTEAALRTPVYAADALLNYAEPRRYWRDAVYRCRRPVLYVVRPGWLAQQGENLVAHHPSAELVVMEGAGHALFVDQPERFDRAVYDFLIRRVYRA